MRREIRILFDYTDCVQLCSNAVPQSFAFLRGPVCQELRGFYCPTARQRTPTHVRMSAYHMSAVIFDVSFLLSLLAADVLTGSVNFGMVMLHPWRAQQLAMSFGKGSVGFSS